MNVLFVIFLIILGLVLYSVVRQLRASKRNEPITIALADNADFGADGGDSGNDHTGHHHGSGDHASSHDAGTDAGHASFDGGHGGFDGGGHH